MTTQARIIPRKSTTTKRLPKLGKPDAQGKYSDISYLAAWLHQYNYANDCESYEVRYLGKRKSLLSKTFKSIAGLLSFLENNFVVTRGSSKGKLNQGITFNAIYHTDDPNDPKKDVVITLDNASNYAPTEVELNKYLKKVTIEPESQNEEKTAVAEVSPASHPATAMPVATQGNDLGGFIQLLKYLGVRPNIEKTENTEVAQLKAELAQIKADIKNSQTPTEPAIVEPAEPIKKVTAKVKAKAKTKTKTKARVKNKKAKKSQRKKA